MLIQKKIKERWGKVKQTGYTCGGRRQVTGDWWAEGGGCNSVTDLALSSFWHQSWWGGGKWKPGLVACAVEPGALDLVMTGQRSVTVPSMCERWLWWDFVLVGDLIPHYNITYTSRSSGQTSHFTSYPRIFFNSKWNGEDPRWWPGWSTPL